MKTLDLTNIPFFDAVLDFTVEGEYIDLHNNFTCTKVETDPFHHQVLYHFESDERYFRIIFLVLRYFTLDSRLSTQIQKAACALNTCAG